MVDVKAPPKASATQESVDALTKLVEKMMEALSIK